MTEAQDGIRERVAKIEAIVNDHERRLIDQNVKNETLVKLATLMEVQVNESKEKERRQEIRDEKQSVQMEKFGDTLQLVNRNLSDLNKTQQQIKDDMDGVSGRVTDIESTISAQKIDPISVLKKIFAYVATAVGGIIIAWIYITLGLK